MSIIYTPEPGTIGARVRHMRKTAGLTQQQLSEKLGISRRVVEDVEHNKFDPSLTTLLAYADFFGVSIDWIVGRDEKYYGGKKNG